MPSLTIYSRLESVFLIFFALRPCKDGVRTLHFRVRTLQSHFNDFFCTTTSNLCHSNSRYLILVLCIIYIKEQVIAYVVSVIQMGYGHYRFFRKMQTHFQLPFIITGLVICRYNLIFFMKSNLQVDFGCLILNLNTLQILQTARSNQHTKKTQILLQGDIFCKSCFLHILTVRRIPASNN